MTMDKNELLSALVDGELQATELDAVIELLSSDEKARNQFQQYQCNSNALRGISAQTRNVDLTARISAQLEAETSFDQVQQKVQPIPLRKRLLPDWFWQETLGLAIAASIGALAVIGVMKNPIAVNLPAPAAVAQLQDMPAANYAVAELGAATPTMYVSNRWTVGEPDVADRLNSYLVDHNEYAGSASDIFSNARVIAYEVE